MEFKPKEKAPARYVKTIRVTKELDDKLKRMSQISGHSENAVVCMLIEAAQIVEGERDGATAG